MELISKEYVVELLNSKQMELDAFGETDSAVEVGKAKFTISQLQPDLIIPDNATNGDVIPLDRVKQTRQVIADHSDYHRQNMWKANPLYDVEQGRYLAYENCLSLLDKLIAEGEGKEYENKALEQEPCEDAVSRAEVIDELNRLGRNAFKDDTDYDRLFAFLDNLLPVTPTQRWIPMSERLPQNHENVLVCGIEAINNSEIYAVKCWDTDTWRPTSAPSCTWLAWMPLPTPYREIRTCGNCQHFSGEHACCKRGKFVGWERANKETNCPNWRAEMESNE